MKRATSSIAVAIASLALASGSLLIASSANQEARPAVVEYADSPEGLQHFLQDLFAAIKHKDKPKAQALWGSLTLPNHAAWFTQVFGGQQGTVLEQAYAEEQTKSSTNPSKVYVSAAKDKHVVLEIVDLRESARLGCDPLAHVILDSVQTRVRIYAVGVRVHGSPYADFLDYFYSDAGRFHAIDRAVLSMLPDAQNIPARVRADKLPPPQAENLSRGSLPPWLTNGGTPPKRLVIWRVVVGVDGGVRCATLIAGDPKTAQKDVDALLKAHFKPTIVNGRPVEVELVLEVDQFWLN